MSAHKKRRRTTDSPSVPEAATAPEPVTAAPEAVTAAPGAPAKGSGVGLLMRLFWMFFGNIALVAVAGLLFRDDGEQLVELSVLYWVVVGAIIGSRWLDIFRFGGRTTEGEPATPAHLKKHATVLVPLALVVWAVAAFG